MTNQNETICAIATASGGAIGVIRVSGPKAIIYTSEIFRSVSQKPLTEMKPRSVCFGNIVDDNGNAIDEVLVTSFRSPNSYTGEDSTEISCHGSRYILRRIMELLISHGCRQALPGEYTQRAFLNGKMDLSQAEAVADLVSATNKATHKMALSQLRGNFSKELSVLREKLLNLTSLLELELDFSEEDVNFADRDQLLVIAKDISQRINKLASSFSTGIALKDGVPVSIVGKTNVGKSTLLNKLLHEERAIVSDVHGTTRDVIEDTTDINGVTFRFIDTAGLRDTADIVEQMGIERTYKKISEATIVIWILDTTPTVQEVKEMNKLCEDKKMIIALNKCDKSSISVNKEDFSSSSKFITISAKFGTNLSCLEQAIYDCANIPEIAENDVVITNLRHYEALLHSRESITRVIDGLNQQISGDLLSEDLRYCIHSLSEIVGGDVTTDEILGNIFSKFCIGK
jgi:tRNA modification GTPase